MTTMKRAIAAVALAISVAAVACLSADTLSANAPGAGPRETSTLIFERELPNAPGKKLLAREVSYPPGASTPSHRHPDSAFVFAYVVSGEIESAVGNEEPRVYGPGESWHEAPGSHHRVSRNASKTNPAKLLAVFVADSGTNQLVIPDPK